MPVPLVVKELKIRSLDSDFNEISWKLESTSEDVLDYTFQVTRSEGAEGPYDAVSPPMDDTYIFVDNMVKIGHRYRRLLYKLIIKQKSSGDTSEFGPEEKEAEPDLIALELRKHMNLLFREFAGRRCWVLPVRTFGQRCGCWNATLQKRTRSGCRTCYDTGFIRGYMHPIEAWVQIDPSPNNESTTNVGPIQQNNTTCRLGFYPQLKPRDLLIEPENRRWRVTQTGGTEQLRSPVHQELQIHEVPQTDIEFLIPLQLDQALRDVFFSPARNFTNPFTLENFENEEIPKIYNLYYSSYPPVKS